MSSVIEHLTHKRDFERVEKLNRLAEEEERRSQEDFSSLLKNLERRTRRRKEDEIRVKIDTEMHKAEKEIRTKFAESADLPPAVYPENAEAQRTKKVLRNFAREVFSKE